MAAHDYYHNPIHCTININVTVLYLMFSANVYTIHNKNTHQVYSLKHHYLLYILSCIFPIPWKKRSLVVFILYFDVVWCITWYTVFILRWNIMRYSCWHSGIPIRACADDHTEKSILLTLTIYTSISNQTKLWCPCYLRLICLVDTFMIHRCFYCLFYCGYLDNAIIRIGHL